MMIHCFAIGGLSLKGFLFLLRQLFASGLLDLFWIGLVFVCAINFRLDQCTVDFVKHCKQLGQQGFVNHYVEIHNFHCN